jgi:hypothetical protein
MATKKPPMFMGKESKKEEQLEKSVGAKTYKRMEAKEGMHKGMRAKAPVKAKKGK